MKYNKVYNILYKILIITGYSLLVYIIYKIIFSIKETFLNKVNNSNKQIILLGDSILNNSNYVDTKNTVFYQLKQLTNNTITNIIMKAQDDSKLIDLENQYNFLIENTGYYNNSNTFIFISIGGNDILGLTNKIANNSNNEFNVLMNKYKDVIRLLHSKIPNANIILVGLYYPFDTRFSIYKDFIDKWNTFLLSFGYQVLHLDTLLVDSSDIVSSIEPSPSGSKKIANAILEAINN